VLINTYVEACTDLSDEERYTLACDIGDQVSEAVFNRAE